MRTGSTQSELYNLEELYYPSSEKSAVKLVCAFIFARAKCRFSHDAAHIDIEYILINYLLWFYLQYQQFCTKICPVIGYMYNTVH